MTRVYRLGVDDYDLACDFQYTNVVFTNGCFDMLHPGHLSILRRCVQRASGMNGIVVVGVNSDASVRRLKGPDRPIFGEEHRAGLIAQMRGVYRVVVYDEDTPQRLIDLIGPWLRLVVKGGDYTPDQVIAGGAEVEIAPTLGDWSTSRVIESFSSDEGDRIRRLHGGSVRPGQDDPELP